MEWLIAGGTAAWLGILTSISPCPLATNIAAVSYISRRMTVPSAVIAAGLLYGLGRMLTYAIIAALTISSLMSTPGLSHWLQKYVSLFIGPLLILVGMVLVGLLTFSTGSGRLLDGLKRRSEQLGLGGSFLLGALFALSFCPTSAALYFGALLPLCAREGSTFVLPLVYGAATALPVVAFGLLLSLGAKQVAGTLKRLTDFERWARLATGVVLIGIGVFLTISHSLRILS